MSFAPTCSLVELSADCHCACLSHALQTENEEVMGLLVGESVVRGDSPLCLIYDLYN